MEQCSSCSNSDVCFELFEKMESDLADVIVQIDALQKKLESFKWTAAYIDYVKRKGIIV